VEDFYPVESSIHALHNYSIEDYIPARETLSQTPFHNRGNHENTLPEEELWRSLADENPLVELIKITYICKIESLLHITAGIRGMEPFGLILAPQPI
jgi:hypothetical protein